MLPPMNSDDFETILMTTARNEQYHCSLPKSDTKAALVNYFWPFLRLAEHLVSLLFGVFGEGKFAQKYDERKRVSFHLIVTRE